MDDTHTQDEETYKRFERLFHELSDSIYRLCLYKTSDPAIAENLTQETFLRLWKSMVSGTEVEQPKFYLYQIARNLIIDHYRLSKSFSLDELVEEGFDPPGKEDTPDHLAELALLRRTIESLQEEYRDVVYLRFVEGLPVQEIAKILQISENLASVRINRGKKKLVELCT